MKITLKRYAVGGKERESASQLIGLEEGATVRDLLGHIAISDIDVGILTVNRRRATFDQLLADGDTVTIIPPIGGG